METIKQILEDNGYTVEQLKKCMKDGCCNGMGPKGHNLFKYLPNFKSEKYQKLKEDLNLISCIHDIQYTKGGNTLDFLRANFILGVNVCKLIHWTNVLGRIVVFVLFFLSTTLFGWRYFNWHN